MKYNEQLRRANKIQESTEENRRIRNNINYHLEEKYEKKILTSKNAIIK